MSDGDSRTVRRRYPRRPVPLPVDRGVLRPCARDQGRDAADPGPVLFLEHKKCYRAVKGDVPDDRYLTPIGAANVSREGEDLTVVSYGYFLHVCLEAAE